MLNWITRNAGWFAPLVIVLGTATAYLNSFAGVFLFDDLPCIVENRSIREVWPPGIAMGPTLRPLLFYSFAINYQISGLETWSYHAFNLAIHVLSALALFGLVRRTASIPARLGASEKHALGLALASTLIWALHPLHSQSVTYVVQRGESLMGLLFLSTLYCVVRGSQSERSGPWYVAAVVLHTTGLGVKEVMATCLPVLFLLDATVLAGSVRQALRRRWGLYLGLVAPPALAILPALFGTKTRFFPFHGDPELPSTLAYALTQPGVLLYYFKAVLWPFGLVFDHGWPIVSDGREAVLPALALAGLVGTGLVLLWRKRIEGLLLTSFFLILAPTSSVVPIRDAAVEHRLYLSSAALILIVLPVLFRGLKALLPGDRRQTVMASALLLAIVTTLGLATRDRNELYRSPEAIWTDVIRKRPENPRAHNSIGAALAARGELAEAEACYREALRLKPDYPQAHNNLSVPLMAQGRYEEALDHCQEALRLKRKYVHAGVNLGMVHMRLGQFEAALEAYREAVRWDPDLAVAHNNLGTAYDKLGDPANARASFLQAIAVDPKYGMAYYNLGNVELKSGRLDEALDSFREVVRLHPDFFEARNNLAYVLQTLGRHAEAQPHLQHARRLAPAPTAREANLAPGANQVEARPAQSP